LAIFWNRRPWDSLRDQIDKDKDSPTARVITFILLLMPPLDGKSDSWFGVTGNRRLILQISTAL